jgi:hypothetical protein
VDLVPDPELDAGPDADPAPGLETVLVSDLKPDQLVCGFNLSKSGSGQKLSRVVTLVKTCIGSGSDTSNYGSSKKFWILMDPKTLSGFI